MHLNCIKQLNHCCIFFFLSIKSNVLIKKEPRFQEVHRGIQKGTRGEARNNRTIAAKTYQPKNQGPGRQKSPQHEANHSKKPINEEISSPMYRLFQPHNLETKECLSFCTFTVPSLKTM